MINSSALIIVLGTIVALVAIQRALTKLESQASTVRKPVKSPPPAEPTPATATTSSTPAAPAPAATRSRGIPLIRGLSIVGLDDRGVDQLKGLIHKGDTTALAIYLASQRPGIIELDEYLKQCRTRFKASIPKGADLSDPDTLQAILTSFSPGEAPAGLQLNLLSAKEQLAILTFNPASQRLISRDFIALFGGQAFNECFGYYRKHKKSVAKQVLISHPDRQLLETLAQSEVADKGRQIPLALRLTVLNMDQLKQMSKDLNTTLVSTNKQEVAEELSQIPGSAVLLSMQYTIDDLFILNPLKLNEHDINREWNFLLAYARLLTTRMNLDTGLHGN